MDSKTLGRKKSYDSEEVVSRAMSLFWERGYDSTSMADLLKVAGINRKSLYNEFQSKQQLFLAALEHYRNMLEDGPASVLRRQPLGLANIVDFFNGVTLTAGRGCLFTLTINESSSVEPEALERVRTIGLAMESAFLANLEAARELGEIDGDSNPRELASYLGVCLQGLTTRARVVDQASELQVVVDVILESLRRKTVLDC